MLELFILVTASFSSFFAGNILGWSSAMKAVKREKEMEENLYKKFVDVYKDQQSYWEQDQELWNRDPEKQKLIDDLVKYQLEYDPKSHIYYKVEEVEAELVDECDNIIPFQK